MLRNYTHCLKLYVMHKKAGLDILVRLAVDLRILKEAKPKNFDLEFLSYTYMIKKERKRQSVSRFLRPRLDKVRCLNFR